MKIENCFRVELPVSQAWATLLDIQGIATCVPGAELLGVEDERSFHGQVKVKLGPVSVAFKGRVRLAEVDEVQRQVLAKASGTEQKGRGSAQADVSFRLSPDGSGTRVDVVTDLTLAGPVAQYGRAQGVIAQVAQVMVDQFAQNLSQRIIASRPRQSGEIESPRGGTSATPPQAPVAPAISVFSLLGALLQRWLARLIGKQAR